MVLVESPVEYLTYVILESRYHITLWSYDDWPLNYKGRISAISSCIFGLMALFLLFAVGPLTKRIYESKKKGAVAAGVIVLTGFCVIWEIMMR